MTTLQDQINETRLHLYSGERDQLNTLSGAHTNVTTSIAFTTPLAGVKPGSILGIETELCLVTAIAANNNTATVIRGYLGSTGAAHASGTVAWVNPKFSEFAVFRALVHEYGDLSSPLAGLFQMKTSSALVRDAHDCFAFAPADLESIYDVRRDSDSAPYPFRPIKHWDWNGTVIRVSEDPAPATVIVRYKAPFTLPTTPTDDVLAVTGLHVEAHDIPPLGAAARLVAPREVKRGFTEHQGDARRASEVPPGTSIGASRAMQAIKSARLATEAARLMAKFPPFGV